MIAGLLLIIIGVFHLYPQSSSKSVSTVAVATSTVATSSRAVAVTASTTTAVIRATAPKFSIDARDTGFSWKLSNSAPESVIKKSKKEISSLTKELHKGKYSDYNIYLQLGQEYEIVNEGKQAYESYSTASTLKPSQGVAMSNIGLLMARVGAINTARNAYAQSVARQPSVSLFWVLYLKFLAQYEPHAQKTPLVFSSARKITKDNTNVLIIEAKWLSSIGNNKSAIADWEIVRTRVSGDQQKAIDTRITSLKSST